jgi:hypothetical protein
MLTSRPLLRRCAVVIVYYNNNRRNTSLRVTLLVLLALLENTSNLCCASATLPVDNNEWLASESCNDGKPLIGEVPDTDSPWNTDEASDD